MANAPLLGGGEGFELDAEVYGAKFNGPLVHEVVVAELAARRRGTHATKNRAAVRGGGAKPYRQKGTGRARQGSTRAPQFAGGGTVFGPSPHHYIVKVNKKARRAALRASLSVHAARSSIFAVDASAFDAPKTSQAAGLLDERAGSRTLIGLGAEETAAFKSFRNLPNVTVLLATDIGVADIIGAATLVLSSAANDDLVARAAKPTKTEA